MEFKPNKPFRIVKTSQQDKDSEYHLEQQRRFTMLWGLIKGKSKWVKIKEFDYEINIYQTLIFETQWEAQKWVRNEVMGTKVKREKEILVVYESKKEDIDI